MEFYIYITNDCNLNCAYCSVLLNKEHTNIPLNIQYPLVDLKKFIDKVQKENNDKFATICFFGGEPTLDYGMIETIISNFDKVKSYEISFILHTNGLLLSKIPDKLASKIDVVFVSLNYDKLFNDGRISNYYLNISKSLHSIKQKNKISVIGRLTITNETSLTTACVLMENAFDYVYWQIDNREQVDGIIEYKTIYKAEITTLFDYWLSNLKSGKILNYIPFLSIVKNLVDSTPAPKNYFCGYGFYSVFIQTDGTCYTCCEAVESSKHKIGDIHNGIKFVDMNIANPKCLNCLYLKLCGGRCGRMHKDFSQKRINDFCELNIFTFKLFIDALPQLQQILNENTDFRQALNDYHIDYTEQTP